ncbi:MAG: AraC family transcriptional regulator [Planctomycetes bacterium]|nr:AraC family transcriptional regulator [Planctomycetota bacterium]
MARVLAFKPLSDALGVRLLAAGWAEVWPGGWDFPCLCRDFWVLYRNDRDGAWVEHDGLRTPLAAGCAYLIPAWKGYRTGTAARLRHFYGYFEVRGLGLELMTHDLPGVMAVPATADDGCLARLAAAPGRLPGPADQARLVALAAATLAAHLPAEGAAAGGDPQLAPALRHMAAEFRAPQKVARLAALCALGDDAFTRRFRAALGATPAQYLRRLRVQEAARLLLDRDLGLAAVARACGLGNPAYLSRVFRAVTGMAPAAWRRSRWRTEPAAPPPAPDPPAARAASRPGRR